MLKEADLPFNVTPGDSEARRAGGARPLRPRVRPRPRRAVRLRPAGAALERAPRTRWISQKWPLRRGATVPQARRFPRSASACRWRRCPMSPPAPIPTSWMQDPTEPRGPLPARDIAQKSGAAPASADRAAADRAIARLYRRVRTALRDRAARRAPACLHAADRASRGLSRTARGDGGQRARDLDTARAYRGLSAAARLAHEVIRVAPDPGVIEVNVHPADDWDELVDPSPDALRTGAAVPAGHGKIHDRRAPCRHRRRQPCGHRRRRRPRICPSCAGPTC